MGSLGCGTYEVYLYTRGGVRFVTDLPWRSVSWGRAVDETSTASAEALVPYSADCRPLLADVRPWQHEVALLRDGDLVWQGPITGIRCPAEQYRIDARDLTAWFDHRLVYKDHRYVVPTDLATIFEDVVRDALEPDESPRIVVNTSVTGIKATMTLLATQHQKAGVVLRDLARSGIDWTAFKRSIIAGGTTVPVQSIGTFTDAAFAAPPTVVLDGTQQANSIYVAGSGVGSSGSTVYAHAADRLAVLVDGLLADAITVSNNQDFTAALAAAKSRLALSADVVGVQDAILSPLAPVSVDDLIPGALCQLSLIDTVIPVEGVFRLQSVTATVSADTNTEQIRVVFQPPGTTA